MTTTTTVNIFLSGADGGHVLALSIPTSDIQRLSIKHVKWLRYVTFAVCGAFGHLSETPGGHAVDYDTNILAQEYYYVTEGNAVSRLLLLPMTHLLWL
jgi:hypothetical protein